MRRHGALRYLRRRQSKKRNGGWRLNVDQSDAHMGGFLTIASESTGGGAPEERLRGLRGAGQPQTAWVFFTMEVFVCKRTGVDQRL